jgi:hypothetical protein
MNKAIAEECTIYDPSVAGLGWVQADQDLMRQYGGMWVVAIPGQMIAYGRDPDVVQRQAEEALGLEHNGPVRVMVSILPDSYGEWPHG